MRSLTRLALVAAAMALVGSIAAPASAARTQGENDAGIQAAADQATAELQSWAGRNPTLVDSTIGVDILVYVHVFYDKDTGEGKLTNQQALDQVKWLNYSFGGGQGGAKTRFDFVYRSYENIPVETRLVDVSGNTHGDGSDYGPRTRKLMGGNHVGGVSVLNLYVADLPGGTFGVSTVRSTRPATPGSTASGSIAGPGEVPPRREPTSPTRATPPSTRPGTGSAPLRTRTPRADACRTSCPTPPTHA